jgi:hypothetical protein
MVTYNPSVIRIWDWLVVQIRAPQPYFSRRVGGFLTKQISEVALVGRQYMGVLGEV